MSTTTITASGRRSSRTRVAAAAGSVWALGILLALVSWGVSFVTPLPGLDPSWWAGLYMGVHDGLQFGREVIFTYGPLGFLGQPWLWYGNLAVLAFVYQALLHVALSLTVIWALRRPLTAPGALVAGFLVLVTAPTPDVPVALAAIWCLIALRPDPPAFALPLVVVGGALLGAIEALVELRPGPVILAMCLVTVLARGRLWRELPAFVVVAVGAVVALWFAAGQGVGSVGDFLANSLQIVSGYSQAMSSANGSTAYLVAEIVLSVLAVLVAVLGRQGARLRVAAGLVSAIVMFSLFKEAAVRPDLGHVAVFFGTVVFICMELSTALRPVLAVVALAVLTAVNLHIDGAAKLPYSFNPVTHVREAVDGVRLAFEPHHRALETLLSAIGMADFYKLSPVAVRLLRGHTVDVTPWEQAAAWTYDLHWRPLPVLQDYSAYTAKLDALDAHALAAADGPERILREAVPGRLTIDERFVGWDPPAAALAMLCHYVPLYTDARWEVLGRVADRCGAPRLVGSVSGATGAVRVPAPPAGGVIFARVHGLAVSGLDSVRSLLYRAPFRYALVNGGRNVFRVIPGTAQDGLILDAAPRADYPGPFAISPQARTIAFTGAGRVRIDFYAMTVGA